MKTLVIYDSFFGNTEKVAQAVGTVLNAEIIKVQDIKPEHLVDLDALITGSPTRAFSPSPGIKSFLKGLGKDSLKGIKVAAFDTRISIEDANSSFLTFMIKLFGYAAESMEKKLIHKGGTPLLNCNWFFVVASEGPLKEGELENAIEWAEKIKNLLGSFTQ